MGESRDTFIRDKIKMLGTKTAIFCDIIPFRKRNKALNWVLQIIKKHSHNHFDDEVIYFRVVDLFDRYCYTVDIDITDIYIIIYLCYILILKAHTDKYFSIRGSLGVGDKIYTRKRLTQIEYDIFEIFINAGETYTLLELAYEEYGYDRLLFSKLITHTQYVTYFDQSIIKLYEIIKPFLAPYMITPTKIIYKNMISVGTQCDDDQTPFDIV